VGDRRAVIVYDGLPIASGGAHHLRTRKPLEAWSRLSEFLDTCATAIDLQSAGVYLRGEDVLPLAQAALVARSATEAFGASTSSQTVWGVAGASDLHESTWPLDWSRLQEAVAWVAAQEPLASVHGVSALSVGFNVFFQLRDPRSGEVLPWQGHEHYPQQAYLLGVVPFGLSRMYAQVSQESRCSITLALPFEDVTDAVRQLAADLDAHLPFRLSHKQWTRWQLNKGGTAYYPRRVSVL
jgi:hypothetical protein